VHHRSRRALTRASWCSLPLSSLGRLAVFQRGGLSIVKRSLNMFTLIAIGTGSAYGYSVIAASFRRCSVFFPYTQRRGRYLLGLPR
jgi:cation transport ATPase